MSANFFTTNENEKQTAVLTTRLEEKENMMKQLQEELRDLQQKHQDSTLNAQLLKGNEIYLGAIISFRELRNLECLLFCVFQLSFFWGES